MIGQTLNNRYIITARIGKGAMGTVYRATDSQTNQEVAIKIISRELTLDPKMIERFKREGEALRQLCHPNIVGFVDAFQHDEQYLIVMEYVGGGNLHDLIKQGSLSIDRARQIALDLCDALTRAHRLNIIHRDIKPENVLLATDGTPRLTDFGVAKLMSEATRLTGTGTQIGTPYYMSPEAWEGKPLNAQADIWSLGVVMYEMLTGEVPFGGETLVAVMNKVLTAPLPDLKTKRADTPDRLSQIVQRTLTRDKTKRYSTTRQVAADLELTSSKTVSKRSEEPALHERKELRKRDRPERQIRTLRVVTIMLGGFAVVGMIAAVAWLFNELSLAQTVSQRTAAAVVQTNRFATEIASRPTETMGPTPTIDINAAATLQQAATQTFAPFATQTQAALQTIIALTPTHTPTITRTPSRTLSPTFTVTPTAIRSYVNIGPQGCQPGSTFPAGEIVISLGVGRWSTLEQVNAAVGDTIPKFTVNGRQVEGTPLRRSPTWHTGDGTPGYGVDANIVVLLQPGEHDIVAIWTGTSAQWQWTYQCKLTLRKP